MKSIQLSKKAHILLLFAVMLCLLTCSFALDSDRKFQLDSEDLVISAMKQCRDGKSFGDYGLYISDPPAESPGALYDALVNSETPGSITFTPYKSQIGLQGYIFSMLTKLLPFFSLKLCVYLFRGMCAGAMAITLALICIMIAKKYNAEFAAAFFLVSLLSPWLQNFAPNLFWVSFTWFVPMLLGLWLSLDYKRYNRWWMYALIFLSILIKCLCGYEYISTIMMGLITFPLVDWISWDEKVGISRLKLFIIIFKMGLAAVLAFLAAIFIHGIVRGSGNPVDGILSIWTEDVLRRTLGGSTSYFPESYEASLNASIGETVLKYFIFHTEVIEGIAGILFLPFITISGTILIFRSIRNKEHRWELAFAVVTLISTLSWLILGKAHSYVHTHMNYVLWYFGFIQICLYSVIAGIKKLNILARESQQSTE